MANFQSYSSAVYVWYVMKDGKQVGKFFDFKADADKLAKEVGGTVHKCRW